MVPVLTLLGGTSKYTVKLYGVELLKIITLWRAVYAPGDGQTSPAYSGQSVQCLNINHLLSVNKLVLSYLFRTVKAEWPQCRRCQALNYWGSGSLEYMG
jgi:hypothetical protein